MSAVHIAAAVFLVALVLGLLACEAFLSVKGGDE